jgi:hypothetical protein
MNGYPYLLNNVYLLKVNWKTKLSIGRLASFGIIRRILLDLNVCFKPQFFEIFKYTIYKLCEDLEFRRTLYIDLKTRKENIFNIKDCFRHLR